MTGLTVPAHDHGAIYVLHYDGPALDGLAAKSDAALLAVLGPVVLDTTYVDVIAAGDLPLDQLIRDGYDLTLTDDQAQLLRALSGCVIVVMSRAFGGQAVALTLPRTTQLVMVLRDPARLDAPRALTSAGASGDLNGPAIKTPKSDARIGGMVATAALIVMFALVGLMVWVGG